MVSGIDAAATGMIAQQLNIDVISNNLANVNTAGFKELIPVFKNISDIDLKEKNKDNNLNKDKNIGTISAGSTLDSTILDLKQGALKKTDNKLDFAVNGGGFFAVKTPEGELYTRDGSFSLSNDGTLVTKDGYPVLGQSGSGIKINTSNTSIDKLSVNEDGSIFLDKQQLDKLKIVDFSKATDLTTVGNSLYKPVDSSIKPTEDKNSKVDQGFLEGSNSNTIETMINTISATRTYETLSKVLKATEGTLEKAVNDVGRVKE